jgi:Tfp pilus assembly protein PilO
MVGVTMSWLLMLILLSSILSWVLTHKYQEEIIELKKKHDKELDDYRDQIYEVVNDNLELKQQMQDIKRRNY